MAIMWMDNFNIYGADAPGNRVARLLNGVYAQIGADISIDADPDPTVVGLLCLRLGANLATSLLRKVLPGPRTTVGCALREWMSALPANAGTNPVFVGFRDVNNNSLIFAKANPAGGLEIYRTDAAGDVLIGASGGPVLVANAWKHLEIKAVFDVAAGSIEARIEGVTVINVAGIRTTSNVPGVAATCSQVEFWCTGAGMSLYLKDLILWDNQTGFNNDFMGTCQVMKIIPDADVALNWTPFPADGIGYNKINEITPDDDASYISAAAPAIPAPYKCSLTDLPVTVTSVRGVMPIHRSRKIDGGDGNIQVGAVSGGSTGLGVDRPITTAYTYWWDIFDTDPATAAAWTRASVNAMNLQLNRTL